MSTTFTPFDKLSWGDPMLAQIGGSDAQAYATDPTSDVLKNMTSGFEQAPPELSNFVSGALQPAQVAANAAGDTCDCSWLALIKNPGCIGTCMNPLNPENWANAHPGGNAPVHKNAAYSIQQVVTFAVLGLLAVGLILLGVKSVMEA